MDPSHFPASSCVDNMDHEQHEKLVPSHSTGSLCIARFQPLNPGSKTPTYIHDKNSDDDDDLDESESNDESDDEISDSSSYKNGHGNFSSNTDVSSTNSNSRSFHPERIAADHNIIDDKYVPDKGFRSKKTVKQQHCSEIHGREFNKNNAFKLHFQVPSNERPYICYICNRSFTQREHLEFHIDNHTKIKLYCEICGQKFKKAGQLSKHLQIHSGEKTYKCHLCSQGFIESSGLYSHLRSHYLIQPFSCAACKKTFARRQNLKGHLIKAHNLSDEMVTYMLPQKRKAYEHLRKTSRKMSSNKIHKMFVPRHKDSQTSSTKDKAIDPCIDAIGNCSKSNSRHTVKVVDSAADSLDVRKADQTRPLSVEINTLLFDEINELQGENNGDHKTVKISQCHTPINGGIESQTGSSSEHYESKNSQNNTNMDGFSKTQTNSSENRRKFLVECADDNVQNSDFSKSSDTYVEELINAENCSVGKNTDNNYYSNIAELDPETRISLPEQPPYPCSYCEQQFSRRSNLKAHVKIHLGVKPFPCPTCKKNFNRKSNLKVHMAKVHNYDKNAIMERLKTYCSENNALGDTGQNNTTKLNEMDSMDVAMPILIKDVADNEGQEKHLVADNQGQSCHNTSSSLLVDKSTDSLNGNNHLLFSAVPGCNFSVSSFEPYSDINQTNENMYLHNSDHYLPLYPTEDNATYNINSTSDTFKENIFLSANNDANMPPYDAQNMFQNELSSELKMSLIKDEQMDKEFSLNFHSQMPSKMMENQSEITSDLKDSFNNDSVSKTYECKICGHKFSRRGNLMGHYKVHSGIRQFVCPLCQKPFTRKSNLRVHLLKIHNMNEEVSAHLSELGKQQETGADMQENDVLSSNSFYSYFD